MGSEWAHEKGTGDTTPQCSVNRISLIEVEKLLLQQYNTDFQERNYDDKEELSQEDKQFMQSVVWRSSA